MRERTLRLPGWPASLDGVRVALVSDLHAGSPQLGVDAVERLVARVQRRRPDLICVLGDLVDSRARLSQEIPPEAVAARLGRLRAPLGVVAVLGNHDWLEDGPRVAAALRDSGIPVLENGWLCAGELVVAGVADATTRHPDLSATLADVPEGAPVLLLSHDPDVFPRVPARVALTVSGHTHGGQVDLPLVRAKAIPSRYGDRYARGHVVEGGRHLFVTSGVGTSSWPVRLRRPPEIMVLRLRPVRPTRRRRRG